MLEYIGGFKSEVQGVKFMDAHTGKKWSGHGRRPDWYIKAIESGKTPEELSIKA
jgi:DNA-binding protein H-NS